MLRHQNQRSMIISVGEGTNGETLLLSAFLHQELVPRYTSCTGIANSCQVGFL